MPSSLSDWVHRIVEFNNLNWGRQKQFEIQWLVLHVAKLVSGLPVLTLGGRGLLLIFCSQREGPFPVGSSFCTLSAKWKKQMWWKLMAGILLSTRAQAKTCYCLLYLFIQTCWRLSPWLSDDDGNACFAIELENSSL